jgi:hypothetical protein
LHVLSALLLAAFFAGLYTLDQWLAASPPKGPLARSRRSANETMFRRVEARSAARVAILGQSTSGHWLRGHTLAGLLGLELEDIADAHISACDFTCSYAQARRLLAEGRHYERVFFGANLYQMCERDHAWDVFTPLALMPARELPSLLAVWLHGHKPLRYYGRAMVMAVSSAFGDTVHSRNRLREHFELPTPAAASKAASWASVPRRAPVLVPPCAYEPDDIALKTEAVERLLVSLTELADEVFYIALPDRSLSDPRLAGTWARFLAHQRELADSVPRVRFVDMVTEGPRAASEYDDGVHLNKRGARRQTELLKKALGELGVP